MSILSPPEPLWAPPRFPPQSFLQRAVNLAWENSILALPSSPPSLLPAKLGRGSGEGGDSCPYLPPQVDETPGDQFAPEGSLKTLSRGVPWALPQLVTRSLNKPFIQLWGPERNPTRYRPTLGSSLALSDTRLGTSLRRGLGQLLPWIPAPSPGRESLKMFWKIWASPPASPQNDGQILGLS